MKKLYNVFCTDSLLEEGHDLTEKELINLYNDIIKGLNEDDPDEDEIEEAKTVEEVLDKIGDLCYFVDTILVANENKKGTKGIKITENKVPLAVELLARANNFNESWKGYADEKVEGMGEEIRWNYEVKPLIVNNDRVVLQVLLYQRNSYDSSRTLLIDTTPRFFINKTPKGAISKILKYVANKKLSTLVM